MRLDFRLIAVILTVLSSSLAGCLGGNDEEGYSGPIDLVVYYDSTSGIAIQNGGYGNGHQTASEGVYLVFNFIDTTSEEGNITRIYLQPGYGTDVIDENPEEKLHFLMNG